MVLTLKYGFNTEINVPIICVLNLRDNNKCQCVLKDWRMILKKYCLLTPGHFMSGLEPCETNLMGTL